jgi:hypothetical protein
MKAVLSLLTLAATLLLAAPTHAQLAVGVEFTAQSLVFDPDLVPGSFGAGSHELNGGTFFAQLDAGGLVRAGVDIRGTITRGSSDGVNSFAFGPRIAIAPHRLRARIYVEGLIGGAYVRSFSSPRYTGRYADYSFLAGADLTLRPHLDWRVFEYDHSTISAEDIRNQFSTGIVFRFYTLSPARHIPRP